MSNWYRTTFVGNHGDGPSYTIPPASGDMVEVEDVIVLGLVYTMTIDDDGNLIEEIRDKDKVRRATNGEWDE